MNVSCVTHFIVPSVIQQIRSCFFFLSTANCQSSTLFRIQLHNQLLLDVLRNTFPFRIGNKSSSHFSFVPVDPVEFLVLSAELASDGSICFVLILNADNISWFQLKRRNVYYSAIYCNMFVRNQLPGSGTGSGNAHTINRIIQS